MTAAGARFHASPPSCGTNLRSGARARWLSASSALLLCARRLFLVSPVPVLPLVPVVVHLLRRHCAWARLAWLMLQYLTGGAWGVVIRRPAEAAARTLPLLAVLFVPIADRHPQPLSVVAPRHGRGRSDSAAQAALPERPVLPDPRGGLLRRLAASCRWFLNRWSASGRPRRRRCARTAKWRASAGPGLIFWGFTVTFMAIDWVMSLDSALVLHHVRSALHGRPGAFVHGVPDHAAGAAVLPPAHVGGPHAAPLARPRQAAAGAASWCGRTSRSRSC